MKTADECEKAVLGAILADSGAIAVAREVLTPGLFLNPSLGAIFGIMCEMSEKRKAIDMTTISQEMTERGVFERLGGNEALLGCIKSVETSAHVAHYSRYVANAHYDRRITQACREMSDNPGKAQMEAIEGLFRQKQGLESSPVLDYETGLYDLVDNVTNPAKSGGLKTGLPILDKAWISVKPGEINTWCAATNVGKSLMLLNLMNLAASIGQKCLYVGTEMTATETANRHLSILSGVDPWKMRLPRLNEEEIGRMVRAVSERMSSLPISILDDPEPGLKEIEAAIISKKPQVVFLDYLERFMLPKEESMRLRVKEFMRQLKSLSRRRGVIIHLASQLNRSAYGMEEKTPTMAEISESSAVEKESDRIMIMWTPKAKQTTDAGRVIEIIQAKNRHGRRGLVFDLFLSERNLQITEMVNDYANADR